MAGHVGLEPTLLSITLMTALEAAAVATEPMTRNL